MRINLCGGVNVWLCTLQQTTLLLHIFFILYTSILETTVDRQKITETSWSSAHYTKPQQNN